MRSRLFLLGGLAALLVASVLSQVASPTFATVIGTKREAIMDNVAKSVQTKAAEFGIEVVDVRIKRADLPKEVQQSVFSRRQAEREREAKRYRSEGEEEANKRRSQTDKERTIVLADAEQNAQKFRGEGDATASLAERIGSTVCLPHVIESHPVPLHGGPAMMLMKEDESTHP